MQEFETIGCDEYLNRMDIAIAASQNNPSATIYVFVYEGKELKYNYRKSRTENMPPTFGLAKAKISSMKKYISMVRKFPLERFAFIKAGYRENLTVEMWVVPNGETPPEPSPTLAKIKYRKGKSAGFCLRCCGE